MNYHWIQKVEILSHNETKDTKEFSAIIIPENCDWSKVPKIDEMREKKINLILMNVEDFAEMFTVLSTEGEK